MNVKIYSRQAMEELLKGDFPGNTAIISFSDSDDGYGYAPIEFGDKVEYFEIVPAENYCVIVLQDEKFQWGYTLVWDCTEDEIVHLTNTPYTLTSTVINNNVVNLYLVQYWGHPADWWYSISPLEKVDPKYEPDIMPLKISADKHRETDTCSITERNGKIYFQVGKQVDSVSRD